MAGRDNLKPFVKGDPRINRKGRPKNFDKLRELAKQIANEAITTKDGAVTMTTIEAILRRWAASGNPQLQKQFVEVAYGKVPMSVEVSGADGGAIPLVIVQRADTPINPSPEVFSDEERTEAE